MHGNNLPTPPGQAAPTRSVNDAPLDWRVRLPVHPAAEFFPLMKDTDPAALQELAESIKANGLLELIVIWRDEFDDTYLLDGRNRLDAMALVGILGIDDHFLPCDVRTNRPAYSQQKVFDTKYAEDGKVDDPFAIAIGLNIHRRHLNAEQKRELIAKVLAARPELSNRQIAEQVKDDHKKVGDVRSKLEATGAIPQLKKTTGKDGKARPAKVGKKSNSSMKPAAESDSPAPVETVNEAEPKAKPALAAPENAEVGAEPKPNGIAAKASREALGNFKYACDHWLPKLDPTDREAAIAHFREVTGSPAIDGGGASKPKHDKGATNLRRDCRRAARSRPRGDCEQHLRLWIRAALCPRLSDSDEGAARRRVHSH
jgi:hypothetical protein